MSRQRVVPTRQQVAARTRPAASAPQRPVAARAAAHPLLRLQQLLGNSSTNRLIQGRFDSTSTHEASSPATRVPSRTGIPDALKAGVESLSGFDLSDVRVHIDSAQPVKLNALAYAQGDQIHLAPGQEHHLPHEAWHVVQQRQGRVRATSPWGAVGINDSAGLETEAETMGARAAALGRAAAGAVLPLHSAPAAAVHADDVIQMQRAPISLQGQLVDLTLIEAFVAAIDAQLHELTPGSPEIKLGFIDMEKVEAWRDQCASKLDELRTAVPGGQAFALNQIMGGGNPLLDKFKAAVTPIVNLRKALNESLTRLQDHEGAEAEYALIEKEREQLIADKAAARRPTVADLPSPYANEVDTWFDEFEGAVIKVDGHCVVVVEHHQLKHNPGIDILLKGKGSYSGDPGSHFVVIKDAWEDHRNIYSVQVLEYAKKEIAKLEARNATESNAKKVKLDDIEAYVVITYKEPDWIISYHGNPPKGEEVRSRRSK